MPNNSIEHQNTYLSVDTSRVSLDSFYNTFQAVPMEVAIYDLNGNYIFVNDQYKATCPSAKDLVGQNDGFYLKELKLEESSFSRRQKYFEQVCLEKRVIRFTEKLYFPEKNRHLYYKRTMQPVFDSNSGAPMAICMFGSNLTAVVLSQNELKYLAYHDKLTGLRNRDAFYEQLDQTIAEVSRSTDGQFSSVLFCDLDNFKLVNDSLGHDIGDLVLQEASRRMVRCLRKSDYIFRLGGDEFTIILKKIQNELDAAGVAEKLIEALSKPYHVQNQQITYITSSIGIVLFPRDGQDRETLVKRADAAMYNVKFKEKNSFQFFTEEMTRKSMERLKIVNNLRSLTDRDKYDDEFSMVYQPIYEKSANGQFQIIGSEALLRWNNPELGFVSPGVFIPIAEETNLINRFGHWVLRKSLDDFKRMQLQTEQPLYMSVNLSAKQLKSPTLVKNMEQLFIQSAVNPGAVQIEVTETSYLDNEGVAIKNMTELEKMGFRFAIDDFGAGFASLSYLQKIPATTLKIDQSFILNVMDNNDNKELVKSIILLGKNLNKEIIAEGVEEKEHLSFLEEHQCHKYQGYLFSKPLPFHQFEELLTQPARREY